MICHLCGRFDGGASRCIRCGTPVSGAAPVLQISAEELARLDAEMQPQTAARKKEERPDDRGGKGLCLASFVTSCIMLVTAIVLICLISGLVHPSDPIDQMIGAIDPGRSQAQMSQVIMICGPILGLGFYVVLIVGSLGLGRLKGVPDVRVHRTLGILSYFIMLVSLGGMALGILMMSGVI